MPLSLSKLSKRYKNTWALRDVSLEIEDGEVYGIFGNAGAGKTTLLRVIASLEEPSGGTIGSNGDDGFALIPAAKRPSWRDLFGSTSARPQSSEDVIREISAAAAAGQVVLLDDALCSFGDSERNRAVELLREYASEGRGPIIYAGSRFESILELCDRVAVLINGEVAQVGRPQEIYNEPASSSVAAIVGRNNLFTARRLSSSKAELPEYQTIAGGHRLFTERIERSGLAPINRDVTLGIRPEQISLTFGASFPEDNLLKATVRSVRALGPTSIVRFDCGGLELEALVLRVVGLSVGDECMVGLPPDRIRVFKN